MVDTDNNDGTEREKRLALLIGMPGMPAAVIESIIKGHNDLASVKNFEYDDIDDAVDKAEETEYIDEIVEPLDLSTIISEKDL